MNEAVVLKGAQIDAFRYATLRRGLQLEIRTGGRMKLTSKANLKKVAEEMAGKKFKTKEQALAWVEEACRYIGI